MAVKTCFIQDPGNYMKMNGSILYRSMLAE